MTPRCTVVGMYCRVELGVTSKQTLTHQKFQFKQPEPTTTTTTPTTVYGFTESRLCLYVSFSLKHFEIMDPSAASREDQRTRQLRTDQYL